MRNCRFGKLGENVALVSQSSALLSDDAEFERAGFACVIPQYSEELGVFEHSEFQICHLRFKLLLIREISLFATTQIVEEFATTPF